MSFQILIKNLISEHNLEQSVEAMRYKLESRGFGSRQCHRNFLLI